MLLENQLCVCMMYKMKEVGVKIKNKNIFLYYYIYFSSYNKDIMTKAIPTTIFRNIKVINLNMGTHHHVQTNSNHPKTKLKNRASTAHMNEKLIFLSCVNFICVKRVNAFITIKVEIKTPINIQKYFIETNLINISPVILAIMSHSEVNIIHKKTFFIFLFSLLYLYITGTAHRENIKLIIIRWIILFICKYHKKPVEAQGFIIFLQEIAFTTNSQE